MRFESLKTLSTRKNFITENKSISFTDLFNSNVFDDSAMRDFLSREAYESVSNSIKDGITMIAVIIKNIPQSPFNQSTKAPDDAAKVVLPAVPIEASKAY